MHLPGYRERYADAQAGSVLTVRPRSILVPPSVVTPQFRQQKSAASPDAQVANLSVTLDTPATAGRLLVAGGCSDATLTAPSGFSLAEDAVDAQGAYLWYKIAVGGETTFTITPGVSRPCALVVAEYSGIAASPLDQVSFSLSSGAPTVSASPGAVPTTSQAVELCVAVVCPHSFAENAQPVAPTWSNGFSGRDAVTSGFIATGSQNSAVFLADFVTSSIGTPSTTATWTNSSQDYGAIMATFKGV